MPTHHDDLELVLGDEWLIVGKLLDEEGKPLDLSSGVELGWTLVNSDGHLPGLDLAATIEPQDGGIVRIVVPDTYTRLLAPGRYLDAIRVWIGDEPATQWTGIIIADADPFYPTVSLMPPVPQESVFEDAPDDGKLYVRQSGQWVEMPSGFSARFEYQFDDKLVAPPLNSQLRFDNVDAALATKIWLHNNNADGLDVSNLLTLVKQGFTIFVQDKDEPERRHRFTATGPMVNLGDYCELPIASVLSVDPLRNNQRCFVQVYGGG